MADAVVLAPPAYEVRVAGSVVTPIFSSFKISETLDAPDTLLADLASVAAPYLRPAVGDAVVVTEDGVRVFGGTVTGVRERALVGASASKIVVEVQATSYEINAARRIIRRAFNVTGATETIGSAFAALVAEYYAAVGVTLHPAQSAGPVLPAATFDRVRGDEVNKTLAASVGYLHAIDFENRLRAWAPGEILAPTPYHELLNPELLSGDITVERGQLQSGYANRVILTGDPLAIPDFKDTYSGDGVTTTWPVTYQVNGPTPYTVDGSVAFGIVFFPASSATESIGGGASPPGVLWEYDPIASTIHRRGGPVAAGVVFEFPYHGLFVPAAVAEDAAEIAQYGLWEHIEEVTAVTTSVSAQAYADAVLASKLAGKEEIITFATRALGFHPGQIMTFTSPSRALTGDYLITQVETMTDAGKVLLRTLTASKSLNNNHDWRRVYQQWAGASAGGGSSSSSSVTTGGGLHGTNHQFGGMDPIPFVAFTNIANPWTGGQSFPHFGLGVLNSDKSHSLAFGTADLTAGSGLTFNTGSGLVRTLTFVGDPTLGDWFNQNVKSTGAPTFAGLTIAGDASATRFLGAVDSPDYVIARNYLWATNALYVSGFRVTVTANCSIPGTEGGAVLPPTLAYTDASNTFGPHQQFSGGISVAGVDWNTWFNQSVRTDGSPTFANLQVNGALTNLGNVSSPRFDSAGKTGKTAVGFVAVQPGGFWKLEVTGGVITHFGPP